ncbi:hypothetical protein CYY_007109 [Polysphondylium violaceum]|uniref:DNA replication complex GINS protein PSF1 n=1 Tax=Polysphondylium violaceum TaxID=133409 RepID=A0A8J4PY50_9MYCE|nr:hypothetical protein CYY_007109 [Polysphondylium violaceum]
MFTEKAIELLRELKRTDSLLAYGDTSIKRTVEEINALHKELIETISEHLEDKKTPYILSHSAVFQLSILRNKRCILAYLMERLNRIREYRWNSGTSLLSTDLKENLSPNESKFFADYDRLLTDYNAKIGLDLTMDPQPPKELFIEVRVLKELGQVVLNSGITVNLHLNTTHFLRRSDVSNLIAQGSLEHIV